MAFGVTQPVTCTVKVTDWPAAGLTGDVTIVKPPVGTTLVEATDAAEVPTAFVAVTLKV
jgi:hypothetical protein